MIPSIDAGCLPDVNVWIALASDRHEHHDSARLWFDAAVAPVCFCRVTQMSFLRLLTNPKVMGDDSLTPAGAIAVYRQLANDERVLFAPEPPNIENTWISLMNARAASGGTGKDASRAAFPMEAVLLLISLERGRRHCPARGLEFL